MCGIFGFSGKPSSEILNKMGTSLIHRGPDDSGYFSNSKISLGMRRLAIVDIDSGQQPFANTQKDRWVVFNGEIYNHHTIRTSLEKEGYQFRSHHSDTEVIPHLYDKLGIDFIKELNGMFAIALWDDRQQELHLIRDYCGIKPLFYSIVESEIVFGSEIKAILSHPLIKKQPNFEAIYHYFSYKNIPSPMTAFKNIHQLGPGERLVFKNGKAEIHRWWQFRYAEDSKITYDEAKIEIRKILEQSVSLQIQSDAPFGAYLSGGIDSSSVVALASKMLTRPLKTFTMTYKNESKGKNLDQKCAQMVSDLYKTEHYEFELNPNEIETAIEKVIDSFDEPFSGTISTYFLTHLISKHVKVALSGDGADELFGSYLNHRLAQPVSYLMKALADGKKISELDRKNLAPFEDNLDILKNMISSPTEAHRRMQQYIFSDAQKSELLLNSHFKNIHPNSEQRLDNLYKLARTKDPLNRALYVDFQSLLPDQVLAFVDRLSMAHSVEVRPPFLDHRLIEFSAQLPGHFKIKNGIVKSVLKDAVSDLLPELIVQRPKEGFVMPVHSWILNQLGPMTERYLNQKKIESEGILNFSVVERILSEHKMKQADHGYKIWNLLMFQIWWTRYFS